MKIGTFNVNNVNKRLPNLLAWLKSSKPDVVCLQELKAAQAEFPEEPLRKAGTQPHGSDRRFGMAWRSWPGNRK